MTCNLNPKEIGYKNWEMIAHKKISVLQTKKKMENKKTLTDCSSNIKRIQYKIQCEMSSKDKIVCIIDLSILMCIINSYSRRMALLFYMR